MSEDLRLNIRETLRFFDEAPKDSRKHASAIVGVCGEDLGIGLLQKYLKDVGGCSSRVVYEKGQPKTPASGTGSGDRLDRWLLMESGSPGHPKRTVYQVEIKNWSAHAIGGKPLPINADGATLKNHRRERWLRCWDPETRGFRDRNMGKVLTRMQPPVKMDSPDGVARTIEPAIRQDEVQPLICFWWALHPEGEDSSLFRLPMPDGGVNGFDSCWVFSMSTYLRSISESEITLHMPSTARRLDWFQRLFTNDSGPSRFSGEPSLGVEHCSAMGLPSKSSTNGIPRPSSNAGRTGAAATGSSSKEKKRPEATLGVRAGYVKPNRSSLNLCRGGQPHREPATA